jgi:actin-like ATPase involved in cell morphogenesis
MSYQLGVDLGTTYTAAAICRGTEQAPAGAEVVTLGTRSATVASVLYLADDGSILVGEAAERRALTDPDRVVREFKRRIGDDVPLMIAGRTHQAHELAARLVRWVVDQVSEREGGPPRRISVSHPAAWGQHKKDLLAGALRTVGLTVTFLAEPQAAAVSYASAERVEPGSTIAVYDLGGGTFDAAVVRKAGSGFELLGQPEGIERLGGVDFDEVVFGHVREGLGSAMDDLDPDDKDVLSAVVRLRRECVEAKEALSSDTEATIPVLLPELRTQARLTRGEFEAMIRPALEETVEALRRAVSSAGLTPNDLTAVLLVGGSSRIPLVSQLVSDGLGRPVAVDADPKTAIALGAALAISPQQNQRPAGGMAGVGRGQASGPRPGAQSGPRGAGALAGPLAAGAAGAGLAGAGLAGAGLGGTQSSSVVPSSSSSPLGQRPGAPPRPSGPPAAPPQSRPAPAFAAPPRPAVDYHRPDYVEPREHDGYAQPARNRQTGILIGVGGVVAIVAIVAAIFLWPKSDATDTTGSSTELTPPESTSAPTTTPKATTPKTTPRTTPKPTPKPTPTPVNPGTTTGSTTGSTTGTTTGTTTGGTTGGTTTGGTTGGTTTGGTTTGGSTGTTTTSGTSTGTTTTSGTSTGTTSTTGVTGTSGGTASGPTTSGTSTGVAGGTTSAATTSGSTGGGTATTSAGSVGEVGSGSVAGSSTALVRPVSASHGSTEVTLV